MKLYVLFAQRIETHCGQYAPEALAVADEFTMEENPTWIYEQKSDAETTGEYEAAEIFEIQLSPDASAAIQAGLEPVKKVPGKTGAKKVPKPDTSDILLPGVDKAELERQRLLLGEIACDPSKRGRLSKNEVAALNGVVNMLDAWSDMERGG